MERDRPKEGRRVRSSGGHRGRVERRSRRLQAKRRKGLTRLVLIGAAIVVIAAAAGVLVFLAPWKGPVAGGSAGAGGAAASVTTAKGATTTSLAQQAAPAASAPAATGASAAAFGSATAAAGPPAVLVIVQESGSPLAAVLVQPLASGGLALGLPADTILVAADQFQTVSDLLKKPGSDDLRTAVAGAFGVNVTAVATAEWSGLKAAVDAVTGSGAPGGDSVPSVEDAAGQAAAAVVQLMGISRQSGHEDALDKAAFSGDATSVKIVKKALSVPASGTTPVSAGGGTTQVSGTTPSGSTPGPGAVLPDQAAGGWRSAALPGDTVEAGDSVYFEPDVAAAKVLLGQAPGQAVAVEVQNGSGLLGAAEAVRDLLRPLGYSLLAVKNAQDFPDVQSTRIEFATGYKSEASKIHEVLGFGEVREDPTLPAGRIQVIVGKDFNLGSH